MAKLRTLAPRVRTVDTRTTRLLPPSDPIYNSREYRSWRAMVIAQAGGRCEALVNGYRCTKATPHSRVFADHIVELKDGGSLTDPNNGMCLCFSHHQIKTVQARKVRLSRTVEMVKPVGGGRTF